LFIKERVPISQFIVDYVDVIVSQKLLIWQNFLRYYYFMWMAGKSTNHWKVHIRVV